MGKADAPRSGNPFLMQDMVIEMNSFTAFSFGVGPPPQSVRIRILRPQGWGAFAR